METACLSPNRGLSRPEAKQAPTSAGKPMGGNLSPPPLPAGNSAPETPAVSDGRRNSGVKKHHHKHNLKHRYELLETLGRGTYGKVKKAIERHSGREVSHLRNSLRGVNICQSLLVGPDACNSGLLLQRPLLSHWKQHWSKIATLLHSKACVCLFPLGIPPCSRGLWESRLHARCP